MMGTREDRRWLKKILKYIPAMMRPFLRNPGKTSGIWSAMENQSHDLTGDDVNDGDEKKIRTV